MSNIARTATATIVAALAAIAAGQASATTNYVGGTGDTHGRVVERIADANGVGGSDRNHVIYPASGFDPRKDGETPWTSTRKGDAALAPVSNVGDTDVSYSQGGIVSARTGKAYKVLFAAPDMYDPNGAGIGLANRLPFSIPGVIDAGTRGDTKGVGATWVVIEDDPIADSPSVVYIVTGLLSQDPLRVVKAALAVSQSAAAYAEWHAFGSQRCNYIAVAGCDGDVTVTQRGNQRWVKITPRNTALVQLADETLAKAGVSLPQSLKDTANTQIRSIMAKAKNPDGVLPPASGGPSIPVDTVAKAAGNVAYQVTVPVAQAVGGYVGSQVAGPVGEAVGNQVGREVGKVAAPYVQRGVEAATRSALTGNPQPVVDEVNRALRGTGLRISLPPMR